MKISKRRLNTLIENYLLEDEAAPESKSDNKKKVENMTIEIGKNRAQLTVDKKTGGVTLKVTGQYHKPGEEPKALLLTPNDVEKNESPKAEFVELAIGYAQRLVLEKSPEAKEAYASFINNLKPLIDLEPEVNNKALLAKFDSVYSIGSADDNVNSRLA